jgi:hypothetical protein
MQPHLPGTMKTRLMSTAPLANLAACARPVRTLAATLAVAVPMALAATASAVAATPLADWTFSEAAGTTLNLSANLGSGVGGAGGTWDVAIAGLATTGTGVLSVRNTGGGGSGTRTSYADLGPVPAALSSGVVSLYTTIAAWNFTGAGSDGPTLSLALIEGNTFSTAQFTLAATAAGLRLSGSSDPTGNGGSVAQAQTFAASSTQALTVRLQVDLATLVYSVAYDQGTGFVTVGNASADTFTAGVNSLRLSLAGDFTLGGQATRGLSIDRIWVEQTASPVSEAGTLALMLAGLAVLGGMARPRRPA